MDRKGQNLKNSSIHHIHPIHYKRISTTTFYSVGGMGVFIHNASGKSIINKPKGDPPTNIL